MKSILLASVIALSVSAMAAPETSTTTKAPTAQTQTSESSKGIRISLLKPVLKTHLATDLASTTNSSGVNDTNGLAVGYANLLVHAWGWTANAAFLNTNDKGNTSNLIRADGNGAYTFNRYLNLKGGLNLTHITNQKGPSYQPDIGFQASAGVQFSANFAFDLGYTLMHQSRTSSGSTDDLTESGFEVGVNTTF